MLLDSSYPRQNGDQARLISPTFSFSPAGYCLKWFYHMRGQKIKHKILLKLELIKNKFLGREMGPLSVYLKTANKMGLLWRFEYNVGDTWNAAQVTITQISKYQDFSFVFEG